MEFSKNDIPKTIFLNLFFEDFLFCFSESDIVTISMDDLVSIPFSDPISEIVTDHSTDAGKEYRKDEMWFAPESSNQDHDIHPWYSCPDYWERFYTRWCECNQIIPVSESEDELSDPCDGWLDEIWIYQRDHDQYKW